METCSVTGRLLARTPGVRCWWQYEPVPERFSYLPGVYEAYRTVPRSDLVSLAVAPGAPSTIPTPGADGPSGGAIEAPIRRVVVTVGTTDRCFRRLVARLADILPPDAEVLWQTGHSRVDDLPIEARRLVPEGELVAAVAKADVVVSHAGAGSLALALDAGRVPVFVPRRADAGEQIDDHQVELARWADQRGLAVMVEADHIQMADLVRAAARRVVRNPTEELILP